jgi:hypothetical protein
MTTLHDKFNIKSLRNIHQQLNEIQLIATSYRGFDGNFASILDGVTKVAGMFCDLTEQHLKGEIVTSDPLPTSKENYHQPTL